VENGGIELVDTAREAPVGWRQVSPREEISPRFEVDATAPHSGKYALMISSKGSPGTFGYWATTVKGIRGSDSPISLNLAEAITVSGREFLSDRSYRFRCFFKPLQVDSISKSILMRIRWKDERGEELLGEYISQHRREGDWYKADQVLTAPWNARSADIELALQWTQRGSVCWDDISFEDTATPLPRKKIKVATVSYEPPAHSTPEKNRQFFAEKVAAAGKAGADVICLGEGITVVSTDLKYADTAEPVPGPTSRLLG
jgi:hypothetical protein